MDSTLESSKQLNSASEAHSITSLFDLLPSELLVLILSFAVHLTAHDISPDDSRHCTHFPYTALRVSKLWHDIAMTTSDMWTVVSICTFGDAGLAQGQAYAAADRRLVDLHSERSGTLPLHLHIDARDYGFHRSFEFLLAKLVEEGSRWKSLRIVGREIAIIDLLYWLFRRMNSISIPTTIEEIQITHTGTPQPYFYDKPTPLWLTKAFFNLQHVQFCRYSQPIFPLPHLQSLCMDDVHPDAVVILSQTHLPTLTTLIIQCASHIISSLEEVENSSSNQSFKGPNLRSAILYNVKDRDVKKFMYGAPNLEDLAISSLDPAWDLRYLTDITLAPQMLCLAVHNPSSLDIHLREVVESRLPYITRVTVNDEDEGAKKAGGVRDTMKWMQDQVEVNLVPTAKLSFTHLASQLLPRTRQRPVWSSDL